MGVAGCVCGDGTLDSSCTCGDGVPTGEESTELLVWSCHTTRSMRIH